MPHDLTMVCGMPIGASEEPEAYPQWSNDTQKAGKQDMRVEQFSKFLGQNAQAIFPDRGNEFLDSGVFLLSYINSHRKRRKTGRSLLTLAAS